MITIHKITLKDVPKVAKLIAGFAKKNMMLPVSKDFLFEHMDKYFVAKDKTKIVGVIFLRVYTKHLAEIRSLAVAKQYQGKGIGKKLVLFLVNYAREIGLKEVFALTLAPKFFEKLGFVLTERKNFPEKIWGDCKFCPKKNCCDETGVVIYLGACDNDCLF